jgi:O-antigen ligase
MGLLILIPGVVCWAALALGSVRKALLNVYLPCLLLLPNYYTVRLTHLPALTFSDAAILPLGFALVISEFRYWRFAWMDLWVVLYTVSVALSQGLSTELANGEWVNLFSLQATTSHRIGTNIADAGMMFFARILEMILPYALGKLLIERADQEGFVVRKAFVARVSLLLAAVGFVSIVDFVSGGSIWQRAGAVIFPNQYVGWPPQMRWGFGRIAGPYGHAILAGMIFLMGLVYCLWLRHVDPGWGRRRIIAGVPVTVRSLALLGAALGLLMTQSRGPWLGVLLALGFAMLTRVLSVGKAAGLFLALVMCSSVVLYHFGKQYTEKDLAMASSEEQRSAIYRRELLTNYAPVVAQRPAFGWGITTFPAVMGQYSIDNEYLLLAVTQGFVGLSFFLAIAAATAVRLLHLVQRPLSHADRMLVFAHFAVLIGMLTTLATVYMGEQVVMMYFLFTGWVQGMHNELSGTGQSGLPAYGFRRVLV